MSFQQSMDTSHFGYKALKQPRSDFQIEQTCIRSAAEARRFPLKDEIHE
jgi:hypothetical protein